MRERVPPACPSCHPDSISSACSSIVLSSTMPSPRLGGDRAQGLAPIARGAGRCRGTTIRETGSNRERSARPAKSSSRAAAAAGAMPVLGSTRPRYMIRSARIQVLFSRWASATAFCTARASSSGRFRASGARGRVSCAVMPHRRRDRRQRDAGRARELVRPSLMQLCKVQRAVLRLARGEVRRLCELRQFPLRRRAAMALLELRRAARRSAVMDSRREENRRSSFRRCP